MYLIIVYYIHGLLSMRFVENSQSFAENRRFSQVSGMEFVGIDGGVSGRKKDSSAKNVIIAISDDMCYNK